MKRILLSLVAALVCTATFALESIKAVKGYEYTGAGMTLRQVIGQYDGFTSTSPSAYTAATKALNDALATFEGSEKQEAAFTKVNKSVNIKVNGETRSYWLYVPDQCKAGAPVVFALHGAGGHSTDNSPRFNTIADKEKFIVAYPQGKDIYFPVFGGTVPGWDATGEENVDVDFIKAVIEDIDKTYAIDRNRLYCCGFSNGGMMTYALTNTCSDVFAAFASISGFPLNEFHFRHTGRRPVPFLHIHGKQDDFVKYSLMPVIVDEMVARLGANPVPVKSSASGKYNKSIYEAADGSFPYIYYEIDGMGHSDFTTNTEAGSSSQTMWNFFRQYTLDTPCDTTLKWLPRQDTEGFTPKTHGWLVNTSTALLMFGREQNTQSNQNVYHSLQLTTGNYELRFRADGEAGKTVTVKIQKLTGGKTVVLNEKVPVGEDTALRFQVEGGWGEYKLTISRAVTTDAIKITGLSLHTVAEGLPTPIRALPADAGSAVGQPVIYSLSGVRLGADPSRLPKGVYIRDGKKIVIK